MWTQKQPRLWLLGFACLLATVANAQNFPKEEFFVGFSGRTGGPILLGWDVSPAVHIKDPLEIVGDFSGYYGSQKTAQQGTVTSVEIHIFLHDNPNVFIVPPPSIPPNTSSADIHSFMVGPQFLHRMTARTRVFVRALFGATRVHINETREVPIVPSTLDLNSVVQPISLVPSTISRADTQWGFSFGAGGGLDMSLAKHWAVRVMQADYVNQPNVLGRGSNDFRLSSGLIYQR